MTKNQDRHASTGRKEQTIATPPPSEYLEGANVQGRGKNYEIEIKLLLRGNESFLEEYKELNLDSESGFLILLEANNISFELNSELEYKLLVL